MAGFYTVRTQKYGFFFLPKTELKKPFRKTSSVFMSVPSLSWPIIMSVPSLASRRISFAFSSDSSKKYVPCSLRLPVGLPHRFRGHVGLVSYRFRGKGKKTGFLSHLYIKVIFLPRQARDKHRENSKKTFSRRYFTSSRRRKEISGA